MDFQTQFTKSYFSESVDAAKVISCNIKQRVYVHDISGIFLFGNIHYLYGIEYRSKEIAGIIRYAVYPFSFFRKHKEYNNFDDIKTNFPQAYNYITDSVGTYIDPNCDALRVA